MRYPVAKMTLLLAALVTTAAATAKEQRPAPDPQDAPLIAAALAMQQGRSAEALTMIEPVLAAYETQYADEKRRIYCGDGPTETLLYMTMAASAKQSAVAISPNWCNALFVKGYSLIDRKQVEAGLPFLLRAVSMAPQHAHYLNELGYAYQALRRWPESLDAYSRADASAEFSDKSKVMRERTRAWRGMGYVLVEQGKWDEAAEKYRQCLKLDPKDDKAKGELQYIAENRPKST